MQGYIKLYRKTMNSPIWQDPYYLKLWLYCLMKATHKEHEQLVGNQMVKLMPGEFVIGRKVLANDLNKEMKPSQKQSELSWWRYLNNLEKWDMLTIKKTNKFSIISIVKWTEYQEAEPPSQNKPPSDGKKKEPSPKKYEEESIPFKLAQYLSSEIKKNLPEFKEPDLQKWADEMRKIVEIDKRNPKQVSQLIKWTQQNDFWWKNVMSPSKLRKQYDKLLANAKADKQKQQPINKPDTRDKEIEFQRWVSEGKDPNAFNWGQ